MPNDPYQTPTTEILAQPDPLRWPSLLIVMTTLAILLLGGWCFYVSNALTILTEADAGSVEQIEKLAEGIESGEITLRKDALIDYLRQNRRFLLDDIRYQRSAQVNFILVGSLLTLLFAVQVFIAIQLRRRSVEVRQPQGR